MVERVVINTGPLIALAKAEALGIVERLPIEFICPAEVLNELDAGARLGYISIKPQWLRVQPLAGSLPALAQMAIDLGEAAVIQLALEQQIEWVCLDDAKGRRAALAVGLHVTGTLGLLGRAKALSIIPAIRPYLERMQREGRWFHPGLVRRVLEQAGE